MVDHFLCSRFEFTLLRVSCTNLDQLSNILQLFVSECNEERSGPASASAYTVTRFVKQQMEASWGSGAWCTPSANRTVVVHVPCRNNCPLSTMSPPFSLYIVITVLYPCSSHLDIVHLDVLGLQDSIYYPILNHVFDPPYTFH